MLLLIINWIFRGRVMAKVEWRLFSGYNVQRVPSDFLELVQAISLCPYRKPLNFWPPCTPSGVGQKFQIFKFIRLKSKIL